MIEERKVRLSGVAMILLACIALSTCSAADSLLRIATALEARQ